MQSTCVICSSEFTPKKGSKAKTCSPVCREKYRVQRTVEVSVREDAWVTKACVVCGKEFTRRKGKAGVVCSIECRGVKQTQEATVASTCVVCGNKFDHYARQDRNTCSVKCSAQTRGINYPDCKVCGASTGSYNRIYCNEHRPSRPGRKPLPRKTAQCLGCGEEFSRPGHWKGKMKYCSNRCSHREQKKTTDVGALLNDKGTLIFRSTWEMRFHSACLRFDIPIRSYDGPDIDTSAGTYRPDFIINGDTVIDVKGWLRPESEVKSREAGIHLVTKEELLEFERSGVLSAL